MEALSQILAGLGFLGILAGVVLGGVLFLILPWWAIVNCVRSDRDGGIKAVMVVFLVITWSFGSAVYGLFFTRSRALRLFTVFAVLAPVLLLVPGLVSFGTGAHIGAGIQEERERAEIERLIAEFRPGTVAADAVEPFFAVHFGHDGEAPRTATLARFTLDGPEAGTARDIDVDVRHIARDRDNERYFAVTTHAFGTITPSSGRFTEIEVDPSLGDFGWPKGVAVDTGEDRVVVMTSHVYTRFYRYDPRTSDWERLPSEFRDLPLVGLTYAPDDECLFALERKTGEPALDTIHRFNARGASLGSIRLDPAIPLTPRRDDLFQLQSSSGRLILVLPPFDPVEQVEDLSIPGGGADRILVVDPATGVVSVPAAVGSTDAASKRGG